jgi:hypothetical protein
MVAVLEAELERPTRLDLYVLFVQHANGFISR